MRIKTWALALIIASAGIAQAGDYYLYRDAGGGMWLSNQDPRNKDDSPARIPDYTAILKQYRWEDITEEQVAASAAAERRVIENNALRDMRTAGEKHLEEIARGREERRKEAAAPSESTVIVTTPRAKPIHRSRFPQRTLLPPPSIRPEDKPH